jgi:hypothetical protein
LEKILPHLPFQSLPANVNLQTALQTARARYGIPNHWVWTEEEIALLGTAPDAEIAARIGRTASAVLQKRFALGIPRAPR